MSERVGTGNAFTYAEWHAAVLGALVGLVAVALWKFGSRWVAIGLTATFVLATLGFGTYERFSTGQRTIRQEPWYALAGLVLGGGAALASAGVLLRGGPGSQRRPTPPHRRKANVN